MSLALSLSEPRRSLAHSLAGLKWLVGAFLMGLVFAAACHRDASTATPPEAIDPLAAMPERPYDYHLSTLDNGMRVLTLEDHSTPVAAVQLWYHVGSKDERPDRRGFAHMFEHMMFRGTENIGPKAHFEYIRRVGGDANAYTSFDNTTYVQVVPSNQLKMVLWLEAERMAFLKINEGYFDTERKVVAEEYRLGREQPYGTVLEKLLPELFGKHPYRWSPIGDMGELAAADASELQQFWNTYYVPNNATLVVVGDVKHEDVEAQAQTYFGWIPRYPEPPRVEVKEPPRTTAQQITLKERNGPVPIVGIAFRTVPLGHADEPALDLLAQILGGPESSRLYRDLVTERDLAMFATSISFTLEQDGLFAVAAVLSPFGSKPQTTMAALREHIAKIRDQGISDEELAKAKTAMLRDLVTSQLTVESKARRLGEAAVLEGDPERANTELGAIAKLSAADIQRVANTYLPPEAELAVTVEPNVLGFIVDQFTGDEKPAEPDKPTGPEEIQGGGAGKPGLTRPTALAPKPVVAPAMEASVNVATHRKTLGNGLEVVVVPNDEVPFVTYQLGLRYGSFTDPADKPGVAFLALPMVTRGTKSHDYETLTDLLDAKAISLSGSSDMDSAQVSASAISPHAEATMALMAEVVREPTFPAEELSDHVKQTVTGLTVVERSPMYVADREMRRHLFHDHPYARLPEGEAAGLPKIESADLAAWWATYARPDTSTLYIAGAIAPERAFELAEANFGAWAAAGEPPAVAVGTPPVPEKTKIYLVDRAGEQSQIRVGQLGITRNDARYPAARVATEVFGGGFNSRLNDTIRVKKGLTYGARGGFSAERFAGRFVVSTFSKNKTVVETVATILEEITRLQAEAPTTDEHSDAISYIVGNFPSQRETPQELVRQLWNLEVEGLPSDWYDTYLQGVRGVKSGQVTATANELVDPAKLVIIVVGPAKLLAPGLRQIAEVEVVAASGSAGN